MKPINEMKLSFEGRSCNESFARSAVAAFAVIPLLLGRIFNNNPAAAQTGLKSFAPSTIFITTREPWI